MNSDSILSSEVLNRGSFVAGREALPFSVHPVFVPRGTHGLFF